MIITIIFLLCNLFFRQTIAKAYSRELNTAADYFTDTYKYVVSDATNTATNIRSVYAIDIDGDGYVDLLSASTNTNEIAWWKNDGDENFTKYVGYIKN